MNALYDIFAGINIFDCISFQTSEESEHGKLQYAAESVPAGKDNYVLSTGHEENAEDLLTGEQAGNILHMSIYLYEYMLLSMYAYLYVCMWFIVEMAYVYVYTIS